MPLPYPTGTGVVEREKGDPRPWSAAIRAMVTALKVVCVNSWNQDETGADV